MQDSEVKKGQSTQEDRSKGSVSNQVYMTYLRAWGPGLMLPLVYVSIALFDRSSNVCTPLALPLLAVHLLALPRPRPISSFLLVRGTVACC